MTKEIVLNKKDITITSALANHISHSIDIIMGVSSGYKYDGHITKIETNDLEYIKGVLICLHNKLEKIK